VSRTPKDIPLHPPWMARAACRDNGDPEQWFPEVGDLDAKEAAKRVCRECWVRRECLLYDMLFPAPQFGIWGGLTRGERTRLRTWLRRRSAA
jgi:hypothetical protein